MMNKRGTTLVELLVSVTIIAVLSGLVLSAVQATRKSAGYVVHLNWLRQRKLDNAPYRKTLKMVFIGNSHTYTSDIPGVIVEFAKTVGVDIQTKVVAVGGQSLEGHWNGPDAQNAITSEWSDFVVLQEKSHGPYDNPELYHEYVNKFCDLINNDSVPILYLVWADKSSLWIQGSLTEQVVQAMKDNTYSEVCFVGEAWKIVRNEKPDLDLFLDITHENPTGAYLTACVFHSIIHRLDPKGLPCEVTTESGSTVSVSPELANYFQTVAWQVSEKYRKKYKAYYLK
jgi:prepilin-type N-terminal cleavage/methylation domain-containing protein